MKKILVLASLATLLMTSCGDSFFDLEPASSVTIDKVYKTASDYNVAVIGCYAKLQSQVNFYTECCEYRSDNLSLGAPTAGTQDRYDIDHFTEKPSNGILSSYWANFNNNVYRCNLLLDQIDGANFAENLKKQYKGEAMFIRALNYFNMYRIWGGVPATKHVVSAAEALKVARYSDEQMFDLIAGDLKEIVDNNYLPETYSSADMGRATSGAAKALLGKVYLTFHKWTEAKDILSQLIGKYQLVSPIAQVFNVDNKNNNEIIFAVHFNKEIEGEGHSYWYNLTNASDDTNQTSSLLNTFPTGDARKDLITYVQVEKNVRLMKKFYDTKSPTFKTVGNDQILLRYADVLLMYAEALNEIQYDASEGSLALKYLNAVRQRAGISNLTVKQLPTQEKFRKGILVERQREFPYEGQRWFDLVRMGFAKSVMAENGVEIKDYQLLFPIPQQEIEKVGDKSILWQNPGYDNN
ncbi:RagB/SusD family nutrient uptake outer membrane protein [Segatella copri]|uniref:RagB/SusD family nutrient uptake outer membrane protein n=1 Tax=Segatella copri TaxID=165179 RepID=A0AAW4MVJ7_9BACT|nr:RagB/SusD family nutrient uptake outer membrane protein [Segatella copri]MBV3386612.1 RagB/SusD family nutrient uptake outer membrane protein [Segatella copri]MBV3394123.1 RagB/SusD family nutrient uptake outer membrane protein [Segatella copri]MBV3403876.1 RagB/SusD family nutrient uptake outer membrane protein [Segatella copri]